MKIGFLFTSLAGTGGGRHAVRWANKLFRRGMNVWVYTQIGISQGMSSLLEPPSAPLRDAEGDVLFCADTGVGWEVGKKFMELPAKQKFFGTFLLHPEYDLIFQDDSIIKIALTSHHYRTLFKRGARVVWIPGPADLENFYPPPATPPIPRTNIVLTFIKKSGWVAVEAMEQAKSARPDMVLASLGMDGYDSLPLRHKPKFMDLGFPAHMTDELRQVYWKARMVVSTESSGQWGWPNIIAEAMLCKCPVVCSNWEGLDDVVVPGKTALTSPCDRAPEEPGQRWLTRPHPFEVAANIIRLWDDPGLGEELADAAFKRVRIFNVDFFYDAFESLLEDEGGTIKRQHDMAVKLGLA